MKAYPFLHKHPTTGETTLSHGMELRDYFAAKAMIFSYGLAEKTAVKKGSWDANWQQIAAKHAYELADEMMKARENKHE
jgi:hypothetical protein